MAHSENSFRAFGANLASGIRLAFLRPLPAGAFRVDATQVALLVAFALLLTLIADYFHAEAPRRFDEYGLADFAAVYLIFFFATYLVALAFRSVHGFSPLLVALLSTTPATLFADELYLYYLGGLTAGGLWLAWAAFGAVVLWNLIILYRAIRHVFAGGRMLSATASVLHAAILIGWLMLLPASELWYTDATVQTEPLPKIDVEAVYYAQPALLDAQLAALEPQREGVRDIYFVGVGGWAHQDVFLKEVRSARALFDHRFGTDGRSLILVNNRETLGQTPLANAPNLARALQHIGTLMDPEEDLLFLFMTSHGSAEHELAMEFRPLGLNDITPEQLGGILAAAGIQWRVVVVSACYSGGFVEALSGPRAMVMTASAADRQSFGCGHDNDFTYFGKALFDEALRQEFSFVEAFGKARQRIAEREAAESLEPSMPQISVGEPMAGFLAGVEEDLRAKSTGPGAISTASSGAAE